MSEEAASAALRAADEDYWLAVQFAPASLRARLNALFLLRTEIARIPAAVSEPAIGEVRLQWWREAIAAIPEGRAPRGQPALAAAEQSGLMRALAPDAFEPILEAQSRLFYEPFFATPEALATWLRGAEGSVLVAALRLATPHPPDAAVATAEAAGAAFALARHGRSLLVYTEAPVGDACGALLAAARAGEGALDDMTRGALLVASLAPTYITGRAPSGLAKRWRLFRATLTGDLFGH